jgi:hypothetical protein
MKKTTKKKRKGFGLFVLAGTVYTAGVIAFSFWSYFQQRTNLVAEVDQSLIHATHATEQILGSIFIACAVETETSYELAYAGNQKNLNRFANDCHFDVLGAVGHRDTKLWELIFEGKKNGTRPPEASSFHELLNAKLFPVVGMLAQSENRTIRMQTLEMEEYGQLRIAIRYQPVSNHTGYAIVVARNTHDVNQLIRVLAARAVGMGMLLYAMAFPLIVLYHYAQARLSQETADLNTLLQQDFSKLKEREAELEDAIHDLERFNAVSIGREGRIIELKAEVNTLLEQMKLTKRYNVDHVE